MGANGGIKYSDKNLETKSIIITMIVFLSLSFSLEIIIFLFYTTRNDEHTLVLLKRNWIKVRAPSA